MQQLLGCCYISMESLLSSLKYQGEPAERFHSKLSLYLTYINNYNRIMFQEITEELNNSDTNK